MHFSKVVCEAKGSSDSSILSTITCLILLILRRLAPMPTATDIFLPTTNLQVAHRADSTSAVCPGGSAQGCPAESSRARADFRRSLPITPSKCPDLGEASRAPTLAAGRTTVIIPDQCAAAVGIIVTIVRDRMIVVRVTAEICVGAEEVPADDRHRPEAEDPVDLADVVMPEQHLEEDTNGEMESEDRRSDREKRFKVGA